MFFITAYDLSVVLNLAKQGLKKFLKQSLKSLKFHNFKPVRILQKNKYQNLKLPECPPAKQDYMVQLELLHISFISQCHIISVIPFTFFL